MTIAAAHVRRVRDVRLFAMDPADLEQAAKLVRRQQLAIAREQVERNQRMARADEHAASTAALVLGSLLAALGFDPIANDPAEVELAVTGKHCRRYIGIDR
jgi:hypothetical protein